MTAKGWASEAALPGAPTKSRGHVRSRLSLVSPSESLTFAARRGRLRTYSVGSGAGLAGGAAH